MTNLTPTPNPESPSSKQPTLLRCWGGAVLAGAIAWAAYNMTIAITTTFASKPIQSDNVAVVNISVATRTLVMGISALGTFVFAIAAVGLLALGVQLLIQSLLKQTEVNQSQK